MVINHFTHDKNLMLKDVINRRRVSEVHTNFSVLSGTINSTPAQIIRISSFSALQRLFYTLSLGRLECRGFSTRLSQGVVYHARAFFVLLVLLIVSVTFRRNSAGVFHNS